MNEEKKLHERQELPDEALGAVVGGYGLGSNEYWSWTGSAEEALQADYAANGAGMTLDAFIASKMNGMQVAARNGWLGSGSNPTYTTTAIPYKTIYGEVKYNTQTFPAW